jgi:gamma-glutamyltranspeptidase/glutathione hydrolase
VPGAVDGWYRLLKRFGHFGFGKDLAAAAETAQQGFGVTERIHSDWQSGEEKLKKDPDSAKTFLRNGEAPALYSNFRNPDMARAFRLLQRRGRDAYYRGPIAKAIVAKIRAAGGTMSRADLRRFKAQWIDPISTNYHGYDVYEMPPNSQGFATLEMLNIIDVCAPKLGFDLSALGPRSPKFWHMLLSAKVLAYDDLNAYNADPTFAKVPVGRLISKAHAATLCSKIDPDHAIEPNVKVSNKSGTIYLTAADRWGNMVSFIYSIYEGFGSGVTVPGYGFPLQNRGALFSLDPSSPNVVQPGKRPFHTHHPGVHHEERPTGRFLREHGRERAAAGAGHRDRQHDRSRNERAGGRRRCSVQPRPGVRRARTRVESVRLGRVAARRDGLGREVVERIADGRLPGDPLRALPGLPPARGQEHQGRPAGERRLPRRVRPPQGRGGGWLVAAAGAFRDLK